MKKISWLLYCIFLTAQVCGAVTQWTPVVLAELPHDTQAFTQGLVYEEGLLYESTGLYGASSVRLLDPTTGQVLKRVALPADLFGEGLACTGKHLVQLTWMENVALVYDRTSLKQVQTLRCPGEGWGLCFDGKFLWLSNGSDKLFRCDPITCAVLDKLSVKLEGKPVQRLNALTSAGEFIYANVWRETYIVQIDKQTGAVTGIIDASHLLSAEKQKKLGIEDVLNGIAYNPERDTFYLTGKRWPTIFEVRFVKSMSSKLIVF